MRSPIRRFTIVYVAYSERLDALHGVRAQGAAFLKFGAAKDESRAELERRFNEGCLIERVRKRTMPLALCDDWVVLGMWPGDEIVEALVRDDLVSDLHFPFPHHDVTDAAVRAAWVEGRAYGLNGLGEIRRIALADVGALERRLAASPDIPASAALMVRAAIAHLRALSLRGSLG